VNRQEPSTGPGSCARDIHSGLPEASILARLEVSYVKGERPGIHNFDAGRDRSSNGKSRSEFQAVSAFARQLDRAAYAAAGWGCGYFAGSGWTIFAGSTRRSNCSSVTKPS
jgi:hypothetical protein